METQFDQELVDRKVAGFINFLVDNGAIDSVRISQADNIIIRELLERNEEEIVLFGEKDKNGKEHQIPQEKIDKIKVLLGDRNERSPEEIDKSLKVAREVMDILIEKTGFPITGAVVCGSRIDKMKSPRENSDLDMYIYVNSKELLIGSETQLDKWQNLVDKMDLPFQVVINGAVDRAKLLSELEKPKNTDMVPKWGWNPGSFVFVGKMYAQGNELCDDDATEYIKNRLSSKEWNEIRKTRIREIEQRISTLLSSNISK